MPAVVDQMAHFNLTLLIDDFEYHLIFMIIEVCVCVCVRPHFAISFDESINVRSLVSRHVALYRHHHQPHLHLAFEMVEHEIADIPV